jgi:hypothetical protein
MDLVAAPALRRALWPALAIAAAGVILFLALRGDRPGLGEEKAGPAGPMRHIAPASVEEVEVRSPAGRWRFARDAAGWRALERGPALPADFGARLETALALLNRVAPERFMTPRELAPPATYGLDPPALEVMVLRPQRFAIAFGGANPLGHARYARVEGQPGLALVGAHVATAWEGAIGLK